MLGDGAVPTKYLFVHLYPELAVDLETTSRFTRGTNGISLVVREGETVPNGNGIFAGFVSDINNQGQIGFRAVLRNTSNGSLDDEGLYIADGSGISELVRTGDAAPDGNGFFVSFHNSNTPAFNDQGNLLLKCPFSIQRAALPTIEEFYQFGSGGATQIVREGQNAPDGNGTFGDEFPFGTPSINNVGDVAFTGRIDNTTGGGTFGIFRGDGNTVSQIAQR